MTDYQDVVLSDVLEKWGSREFWRKIPCFPKYSVSSFGRVSGPRALLMPSLVCGYSVVSLVHDGVVKNRRVHIIVLEAFVGPPPFCNAIVAHNDGDKSNNNVTNLRWASAAENQQDRNRHGTHIRGSQVSFSKLTEDDIPIIRNRVEAGEGYQQIADDFGVSISTISLIKRRKIWRHVGGSKWGLR